MARRTSSFVCQECGYLSPGWLGRCPGCGQWNTIIEEAAPTSSGPRRTASATAAPVLVHLVDVDPRAQARIDTGMAELNRVLGGGLVAGSVVLVGGEPGVGKSTLLLQALLGLETRGVPSLLVSGEESAAQVKLRSVRLGGDGSRLRLLAGDPDRVGGASAGATRSRPSASWIRFRPCGLRSWVLPPVRWRRSRMPPAQLLRVAKDNDIALILVGHVTKEGELAGPRVLEHMVDAVLSFEGERAQPFRILRAVKNRFGSTNEVGVFQMAEQGLLEVTDPASVFLEEGDLRSGSVVVPVMEGAVAFWLRCRLWWRPAT